MYRRYTQVLVIAATLSLVACGGGGGGSSGSGGSSSASSASVPAAVDQRATDDYSGPATAASITDSATADQAASTATSVGVTEVGGGVSDNITNVMSTLPAGVSVGIQTSSAASSGSGIPSPTSLKTLTSAIVAQMLSLDRSGRVVAGVTSTDNAVCYGGGSATVTTSVSNQSQLSSGDSVSVTYADCVDSSGITATNGGVSITINRVSQTQDSVSLEMVIIYTHLTVTTVSTGAYSEVDGGLVTSLASTTDTDTWSMSGNALYMADGLAGIPANETLLTDFSLTMSDDSAYAESSYDFNYTVSSTQLGGSVTLETINPVKASWYASYPYAGKIRVGSGNASVWLTAIDSTMVHVDYDLDGDGVVDADPAPVDKYWTDLPSST